MTVELVDPGETRGAMQWQFFDLVIREDKVLRRFTIGSST